METNEAQELVAQATELHKSLSRLLDYAPFVFDIDKRTALKKFIQDDLDPLSISANEFLFDQKDEGNIAAVSRLKDFLALGDDVFTPGLYDDIEEARLYEKRFPSPMDGLREASQVYQRSMDDAFL